MLRRLDGPATQAGVRAAGPTDDGVLGVVSEIIAGVRAGGDAALRDYTEQFDGCRLAELTVDAADAKAALDDTPRELRSALELAAARIRAHHEAQVGHETQVGDPAAPRSDGQGVTVSEVVRAVDRAGLYVPGGRAAYPSTVLMTAIPARVAGVPEVALCVPPAADGRVPAVTLAAAALAGVDEIYRIGGAQAVAALAYGTESVRRVDLIVGPGNAYVSAAKRAVAAGGVVGIESPAGPSDLVVVADAEAPADFVAADLLAQAEHGPGGSIAVVSWDEPVLVEVERELERALAQLPEPRRSEVQATLAGGLAVLVRDVDEAIDVVNVLAPEHLELMTAETETLVTRVRNAGAVFVGPYAPTALGDYVAGANHVLPTAGAARFADALRVDDFRKHMHVVRAERGSATSLLARAAARIARSEGLEAHARSLEIREGAP